MTIQKKEEIKLKGIDQSSMHGANSDTITDQSNQSGMDGWMDENDQDKFNFLWNECDVRSKRLINDFLVLPMETLKKEWAIVKNSTRVEDPPRALCGNLKVALEKYHVQQRAAAQRAANPETAQAPANVHEDAMRYQRPHFITEAEWYGLSDIPAVYPLLSGAFLNMHGSLVCRTEDIKQAFIMQHNGAEIMARFENYVNWQPAEDWA